MMHSCPELDKYDLRDYDKPPHWLSPSLKDSPDGDALIFTVVYTNTEDNTKVGMGMKFDFCPCCGEKIRGRDE